MTSRFFTLALLAMTSATALADYPLISHKWTADPWAIEHGGRIYMYCSHDTYSPERGYGYFMNDVTLISSDDLKNWTDHGEVFSYKDCQWGASNTWAPCAVERDGKFYLYYGDANAGGIGVAVADSPIGPFKDTLTRPLVGLDTPGVVNDEAGNKLPASKAGVAGAIGGSENWGMWCFDPGVFVDDDGQAYLAFGGAHPDNSRIIKLKDNMTEVDGVAIHPNTPGFFEASAIHKYKGRYYYSYSGHYYNMPCNIEYVTSRKPFSGYSNPAVALRQPPVNDGYNSHHCIFEYQDLWYMAYHNRQAAYEQNEPDRRAREYQRSVCLDRVYYNDKDGSIIPVVPTRNGLPQLHTVDAYQWQEAETMAKGVGISTEAIEGEPYGARAVKPQREGSYVKISGVEFGGKGAATFQARIKTPFALSGTIEVRLESPEGLLMGILPITGGSEQWQNLTTTVNNIQGIYDLYLVFRTEAKQRVLLDKWRFGEEE